MKIPSFFYRKPYREFTLAQQIVALRFFIDKFSKIPANKWCKDNYQDSKGRRCAMGHCGKTFMVSTTLSTVLSELTPAGICDINDGTLEFTWELGHSPKLRVINYLKQTLKKLS